MVIATLVLENGKFTVHSNESIDSEKKKKMATSLIKTASGSSDTLRGMAENYANTEMFFTIADGIREHKFEEAFKTMPKKHKVGYVKVDLVTNDARGYQTEIIASSQASDVLVYVAAMLVAAFALDKMPF